MRAKLGRKIGKLIPSRKIPYSNYILLAILILGLIIRVYRISSLPMYGDELTIVYDSYSLLKTGMDQTGQVFPLTFKMGAGRPAGYVYGSIPIVAFLGPSVWGVRGLSLLSGLGIIVLMYFLGKKLLNSRVGLWASFLTSISMWDIYLSRGGFEAHFALCLTLLGVVLFLNKKYILFAIFFGLAIFTYPTYKLTLPFLLLLAVWFRGFKKVFKSKSFLFAIIILAMFAGFSLSETFKGTSEERFLRINVFSDTKLKEEIIQRINEQRNLSTLPAGLKSLFYNKPLNYTRVLFENYMQNLSPDFLYLRGDRNPRHNPGEWGMLYLVELPLLFVGFYYLFKYNSKLAKFLLAWILIVPFAPMFLPETAHGLRNGLMLPAFVLISSYSITKLCKKLRLVVLLLIAVQLVYVLSTIYYFAPNKFGSFWSKTAREVSLKAIDDDKNYDKIILSTKIDNIEYAYPVYAKINPEEVISQYGKLPKEYGNVIITDKPEEFQDENNSLILDNDIVSM